ncbi:alpha-L-rhamnosidase [Alicyclobacillus vulcanalis]|uniref:alpha-L-rhamnosidase n=2 Tax=Alicyclobacillus vulcanalis TaxID=252246 RepID=A0A1N7N2M8_9BACL|nr:alpha-L-rhamnosidase [Alicyclobacillus vulcanalis]
MGIVVYDVRTEYRRRPMGITQTNPRFSWKIESDMCRTYQASYRIQVALDQEFTKIVWDSGMTNSDKSVHVPYNGENLKPDTRYFVRVKVVDNYGRESDWSEFEYFHVGPLSDEDWSGAEFITADFESPDQKVSPILRKDFEVHGAVKRAMLYITSLGLYEAYLNGERVSDWVLTPGWTSYHHRLQFQAFDVTGLVTDHNCLCVMLGDGWYRGPLTWKRFKNLYGDRRAVLALLSIEHDDGSREVVVSDETWRATRGPVLSSGLYDGEVYDATISLTSLLAPHMGDHTQWSTTTIVPGISKSILVGQENEPCRVVEYVHPIRFIKTPSGDEVIDFGQNMVVWVEFRIEAPAGTKIELEHAEVLDKNGEFYTGNLRTAQQRDIYICSGHGEETYSPHFTFHGFRYVRVKGWPGDLDITKFVGCVVHTDLERTGDFRCSDEDVNRLQHNIVWGQKGNFVDVPTDCPQRDERLGWTGDAQVFASTAAFNMNVAPFFQKWLRDLKVDQYVDGGVPPVIPDVFFGDPERQHQSSSAWADAAVICPWTMYLYYGDLRFLEEQYDSMKRLVEYMRSQGSSEYLFDTGFHFGDWLGLDSPPGSYKGATPDEYVATAFYAFSSNLTSRTATALGRDDEAREYYELYQRVSQAFRDRYVTQEGRLAVQTQTAHVLALHFDLLLPHQRQTCANELVRLIRENGYKLTTGFVGTPYLCHVLSNYGFHDVACRLFFSREFPSWLYEVAMGATTIWEHWDSLKPDGTFWSDDMNSFNHYAYGSIGDWMYRVLGGINPVEEKPGFRKVLLRPRLTDRLGFVHVSLMTQYGELAVEWRRHSDRTLGVSLSIPVNVDAELDLKHFDGYQLGRTEYEKLLVVDPHVKVSESGHKVCLGSGKYHLVLQPI